jgi:hypothetical protein
MFVTTVIVLQTINVVLSLSISACYNTVGTSVVLRMTHCPNVFDQFDENSHDE